MTPAPGAHVLVLADAVAVALDRTAEDLGHLEMAVRDAPGPDPVRVVDHLLEVVRDARDDVEQARALLVGGRPEVHVLQAAVALVDTAWARVAVDLGDWALVLDLAALARERGEEWPAWLGAVDETRRRSTGSLRSCVGTARAAWGLVAGGVPPPGETPAQAPETDGRGGGAEQR